jgi:hypothetical protein
VPVLIAALSENKTNDQSRVQIGETLTVIGGNQPDLLVPVFLLALADKNNPESVRCAMAGYLALIGTNQPDLVVPALKMAYTNASLNGRSSIAGALVVFPNQSRSMIPLMLADCDVNTKDQWNQCRINLTIAIKAIDPDFPSALNPLLKDLNNPNGGVRQQTINALGRLGTNGYEAVPALLKCLFHSDRQTRIDAIEALNKIGVDSDEYINALGKNLSFSNEYVVGHAEETLVALAGRSELAYNTIVGSGHATFLLGDAMQTNTPALLRGLESKDQKVRLGTLEIFNEFRTPTARPHMVPEALPKLRELSTSDSDPKVRERAADMLYWQGG